MTLLEVDDITTYSVLYEGKSISDLSTHDISRDIALSATLEDPRIVALRRSRQSQASQKYLLSRQRFYRNSLSAIRSYKDDQITYDQMYNNVRVELFIAYNFIFVDTLKTTISDKVFGADTKGLTSREEKEWLRSAVLEELGYLERFLSQVKKMSLPQIEKRLSLYADSLKGVYNSARIVASPSLSLVHWITKKDRSVCNSCKYLWENSPYTKYSVPATPRDGSTLCLSNCRCRILIVRAPEEQVTKVYKNSPSKEELRRGLLRIKGAR